MNRLVIICMAAALGGCGGDKREAGTARKEEKGRNEAAEYPADPGLRQMAPRQPDRVVQSEKERQAGLEAKNKKREQQEEQQWQERAKFWQFKDIIKVIRTGKMYHVQWKERSKTIHTGDFIYDPHVAKRTRIDWVNTFVVEEFIEAAEGGDAEAQYRLGRAYGETLSYIENPAVDHWDKAVEWYRKAALQGHQEAQYWLGFIYREREEEKSQKAYDYDPDAEKWEKSEERKSLLRGALKWSLMAAEQGHDWAQFDVGEVKNEMARSGARNREISPEQKAEKEALIGQAIGWYRKAAAQGHALAQSALADIYEQYEHPAEAIKWLQQLALQPEYKYDGDYDGPERDRGIDLNTERNFAIGRAREKIEKIQGEINDKLKGGFYHPEISPVLTLIGLEQKTHRLTYSSDSSSGNIKESDTFVFIVESSDEKLVSANIRSGQGLASNLFPDNGPFKMRYELKGIEQRVETTQSTGLVNKFYSALVEDVGTSPKKGNQIALKKGQRVTINDYIALFRYKAIGQDPVTARVSQGGAFALTLATDEAEKPYVFSGVDDAGVVMIRWQEKGEKKVARLKRPTEEKENDPEGLSPGFNFED